MSSGTAAASVGRGQFTMGVWSFYLELSEGTPIWDTLGIVYLVHMDDNVMRAGYRMQAAFFWDNAMKTLGVLGRLMCFKPFPTPRILINGRAK